MLLDAWKQKRRHIGSWISFGSETQGHTEPCGWSKPLDSLCVLYVGLFVT